jgi:hypothetical protein
MTADIIGLKNINEWLNQYTFRKLVLKRNSDITYHNILQSDETQEDLIEDFNNRMNELIQPNNFKVYTIEVFGTNSEKKGATLNKIANTKIQFYENTIGNPYIKREEKHENKKSDINTQDYIALAVRNAQLESQLERLEEKLDQIISEEYDDDEDDQIGQPMTIGQALNQTFISKLDTIVDVVLASVMNRNNNLPQTAINGTDTDIMLIIEEFRTINPDIENDLAKLLNLAKTKPDMFKMLISTLRNM